MPVAELEKKSVSLLEWKREDEGHGTLEGYISVKGNIDSGGDRVLDGAYANVEEFKTIGVMGYNHDAISKGALPCGYVVDAKEDARGLYVKFGFHSTPEAQAVRTVIRERMDAGKSVEMSLSYLVEDHEFKSIDGKQIRDIKRMWVKEGGFVVMAMNKQALATEVKSATGADFESKFDALLVEIEDFKSRWETFDEDRKQGLSAKHCERITQVMDGLQVLLQKNAPAEPVTDEVLASLKPDF